MLKDERACDPEITEVCCLSVNALSSRRFSSRSVYAPKAGKTNPYLECLSPGEKKKFIESVLKKTRGVI